jgi:Spy/CpxP family protein refolding chaperone
MKKVFCLILTALLFTSVLSIAQPKKDKDGMFRQKNIKTLLKLTAEQEKQFDDITYKQQQAAIDIRAKIEKNRLDLRKMYMDKNIDESKILQLTDNNSSLQADLKRGAVKRWLDIYKILNDDQKQILLNKLDRPRDGKMMKGGKGCGGMNDCDMTPCDMNDKEIKN